MKIGVDLDGILTWVPLPNPRKKIPWWLLIVTLPFLMVLRKKAIKRLKRIKEEGGQIIIVTARPSELEWITERMLKKRVPFDGIICVGSGEGMRKRKIQVIEEQQIKMFFDDDRALIDMLSIKGGIQTFTRLE